MIAPARTAALWALRAVDEGRIDLPTAVAQSRERLLDERDRALAVEIIIGTVRWQATLDHLVGQVASRPIARIDADLLAVLRLSLYQLLHLTRVPASAVVDDAVDLVRSTGKQSATGFVNAVLRTALRQRNRLPLPERPSTLDDRAAALAYLSITHSHPEWLVERWLDRHGFEAAEQWVTFNNATPSLTLRTNRLRITRDELATQLSGQHVETKPTQWAPDGLVVTAGNPLRTASQGRFVVQDEASQLVSLVVGARPGERVLDLCAAPGGKTTALASEMDDRGRLVASDVRPRRVRLLRDTVVASGTKVVDVVHVPRSGPLPFTASFDRVFVDAPCSGLGTVRRDPDIKWHRRPDELPALATAQVELLARAASVVRPGGCLVYATCSSEPEENDAVVARFLERQREFTHVDLAAEGHRLVRPFIDDAGFFRTLPFKHGLEAFFAAALIRDLV